MSQTKQQPNLLTPVQLGPYGLRNRVVMAPMTRNRAGEGGIATPLTANYYAQRASAGLLITEGTQVSPEGVGYARTPGIHTDAQVEGWRRITRRGTPWRPRRSDVIGGNWGEGDFGLLPCPPPGFFFL